MTPFRHILLIPLLPLVLTVAGIPGGNKPVTSPVALEPTAEKQLPHNNSLFSVSKKGKNEKLNGGGLGASRSPMEEGAKCSPQYSRRSARKGGKRRRGGERLLGSLAGAAGKMGENIRTSARHLCADIRGNTEAVGVALRDRVVTAGRSSDRRQNGITNSLAFGVRTKKPGKEVEVEAISPQMQALNDANDASVDEIFALIGSDGWTHVTNKSGITVLKKFLPAPASSVGGGDATAVVDAKAAEKFACVKAFGTLNADCLEVFKLFLGNERVHEYNENCVEVRDLQRLSPTTKISWAVTPRYGPFKARDFVTVVHYRQLENGTMVVVNRPIEHAAARRGDKYVRAEILIATNIMRPNRADPSKTDFISVTHVNPGGIIDSKIGAKIANRLCAKAPVNLLTSLEKAANSPPVPKRG